jgi:hypothetical protein
MRPVEQHLNAQNLLVERVRWFLYRSLGGHNCNGRYK